MALAALIFDVDGTLAETERDGHRLAFNQAFAEAGLDWQWSIPQYGELLAIAGGKERIQHYLNHDYRQVHPTFQPAEDIAAWAAALHRAKSQHYQRLVQRGKIPLRPGVLRLLSQARQHQIRLAIATTSTPDNAIALLETTLGPEGPSWFEVIAAGDIVPHKKPAPDIYQYVLTQLGLAPQDCLVIEDTDQGLTAATAAGLTTVVTVNDYTRDQNFSAAALILSHLGEPETPAQKLGGQCLAQLPSQLWFDLATAEAVLASSTQRDRNLSLE